MKNAPLQIQGGGRAVVAFAKMPCGHSADSGDASRSVLPTKQQNFGDGFRQIKRQPTAYL
ncbi:hypothetical protein ACOTTU_17540 [Roseobacter sp. EG26]|uniref:hypothetical protein n=1 Tax=Roseobacter sp. EG26 TaxID=3412477 RepID=UPI003CE49CE8